MKTLPAGLAVAALFVFVPVSQANTLKGSTVTGTLYIGGDTSTNYFANASPDNTDTAKIGPGPEFTQGVLNFDTPSCIYTANFSAAKIAISDVCSEPVITPDVFATPAATHVNHDSFEMIFTDPAFIGDTITPIKNGLGLGLLLSGDVLTFNFDGGLPATNRSTYAVTVPTSVTPEPASWQLLALGAAGLLGMAGLSRRDRAGASGQVN